MFDNDKISDFYLGVWRKRMMKRIYRIERSFADVDDMKDDTNNINSIKILEKCYHYEKENNKNKSKQYNKVANNGQDK